MEVRIARRLDLPGHLSHWEPGARSPPCFPEGAKFAAGVAGILLVRQTCPVQEGWALWSCCGSIRRLMMMNLRWSRNGALLWNGKSRSLGRPFTCSLVRRHVGPAAEDVNEIKDMLAQPSWSVNALFTSDDQSDTQTHISQKQLHHLLRLSALPLPVSEAEETRMIKDLESQLQFVRAIQEVDTEGVEPLVSIRDETAEAEEESEITFDTLKGHFAKEKKSGIRGRITRHGGAEKEDAEDWDALACAPKTMGRYIALDNAKPEIS